MKNVRLSYAQNFSCLAGACPDTCCRDWEIALDEGVLACYQSLPGALGERIRAAISDDDGPCFRLSGGECPFLNAQRLCSIQLAYGARALSRNCDYFPRFYEEYGATRELSLSPACPEAARLLLVSPRPGLVCEEDEVQVTEPNELDPQLYLGLRALRGRALELVQQSERPLPVRMAELLALAAAAQKQLDRGRYGKLAGVQPARSVCAPAVDETRLIAFLKNLAPLRPDWPELLSLEPGRCPPDEHAAERYLVYYLFRYFLKAVNDDRLLPRVRAAVLGARVLLRLTSAGVEPVTALYRYVREVEHNPDYFAQLAELDV